MAGTFADFETYRLNGVRLTEEEFGRGSYAVVLRLEYRGLKCAGKQLYTVLYEQGVGDIVHRFEEECRLLAQMRHPNIVQFIGVYFEERSRVPILVMEFLPTTLAKCIDTYAVLPEEVSYSILHDVALGLYHLHSQTPPIVHRDLSANNVLLATNMTAKISDLGVARILNLTPQQMSRMTGAPGTPAYMPPEAMRANPMYNARIDEFSYGVLMIHVLCGRWPMPREPVRVNPQNRAVLLPVSEAERRHEYLRDIGNAHPLMDLILRCVSNDPEQRATAALMVQRMQHMTRHSPPAFPNRVEMLQRIRADATEKGSLREENEQSRQEREELIQHHQARIEQVHTEVAELKAENTAAQTQLRKEAQRRRQLIHQHRAEVEQVHAEVTADREIQRLTQLAQHCQEEFQRSELAHSIEITETRLQLQEALQTELRAQTETHQAETRAQNETHQAEMRTQIKTHQTQMRTQKEIHQTEMRTQNETHQAEVEQVRTEMRTQNETHQAEMRAQNETHQAEMRAQNETHQTETRTQNETHQTQMRTQNETHQAEVEQVRTEMRTQNETHQNQMRTQNETHQAEVEQVRTEMRTRNETHQAEKRAQNETHQAEMRAQNETHQTETRTQNETHQTQMRTQNETHQAEVEQVRTEMGTQNETHQTQMRTQNEAHQAEVEQVRTEMKTQTETHQAEMRAQNETHQAKMRAQNETHQTEMRTKNETHQTQMRTQNETHQAEVEQVCTELRTQNETHQTQMRTQNEAHQAEVEQVRTEMKTQTETHQAKMRAQNETHQAEMRAQNETHQTEMRTQNETHQTQMRTQNETHQAEVEQVRTEMRTQNETHQTQMRTQNEAHQAEVEQVRTEMKTQTETHQAEMRAQNETHQAETRALNETHQTETRTQNETHQAEMRAQNEARKQERKSLAHELDNLRSEVSRLRGANENLQTTVASKNEILQSNAREISSRKHALTSKDATLTQKESELASKNAILERQSSTIREQNEQLTRAREFLSGQKPQPHPLHPQAKITWEPCRDLPVKMHGAQTVVIRGRVYCGGGYADSDDDKHRVFCYSLSKDTWNTLPACPVSYFGLGQVRGKLVTVGGRKKSGGKVTNEVYEFDEVTHSWKQSIPPMPTARYSPAVLSHHSTLTVAGGNSDVFFSTRTAAVEVFREETSQWHTTEPLPFRWENSSPLLINNRWYLLGGAAEGEDYSNRTVCADVDLLLQKALPRDQASIDKDSTNNSAWEVLPNTRHYAPATATFGASLLAVGGTTTSKKTTYGVAAVHAYSPCSNAWIHIGNLPAPRVSAAIAMLSPTELLVIGGWYKSSQSSVYKGLLRIK